ncbi:MAG: hypothetical protein DLM59_01880 [Pseudonocardiales bacterium]|nr:MAG: hypothetical protein DLM56_05680 [Pseudonocardiales bacterium]PZS36042.1 MAG: hypothetical protein DLM59_01880 [Pseudonocardiales bacterium]
MPPTRARTVGAVVVDRDRLLLVNRARPPSAGSWSIPGGHVEAGEDDRVAVAREVLEETGLRVKVGELVGSVELAGREPGEVYDNSDYACDVVGGELTAGDDAADVGWFDVDALATLPTTPDLAALLSEWGAFGRTARVRRRGVAIRGGATAVVLGLLVAGSLVGQDSAFPFGPFRMYSTRDRPDGPVSSVTIDGVTAAGRQVAISGTGTRLRGAEVEGQVGRFEHHPELLVLLAAAYEHRHPGVSLRRVELLRHDQGLRHGAVHGASTEIVLATWVLPSPPAHPGGGPPT